TLKDGLEGHNLDVDTLVSILFAELKAYKAVKSDTGQERYNVLCDLLQLCPEGSSHLQQRAASLTELAQLLCYHSYAQQTDCSSLDSIHEALRLLEMVPRTSQNQDQLLDDQAQALLWLYICTLESNLQKNIEREQRAKAQEMKNLEESEANDLGYEGRLLEEKFLYDGITCNLLTDTALSKSLDDALALWKQLLPSPRVPALRSPEQTVASLQLLAALYKLMAKPLQAMESYLLLRALCSALGDSLGAASALCQLTKLLCQLDCPSYAQVFLEEAESCLREADSSQDSFLLLQQTCLLLRSQLCCATFQIQEGLSLLLGVLQNPALQRLMKVWYLLRAHTLSLLATYLSLPSAHLPPELRQQILVQGWKTPKAALADSQKLLRSILILLMGGKLLGCQKASDAHFVDCVDNLLFKWEVLGDMLAALEQLVALLSRLEVVCTAKAFCLEAVKVAMKLQAVRWCTSFLVLKAQLELQRRELELSHLDLQQALFILESDTDFGSEQKQQGQAKILLRKGKLQGKQPPAPISKPPEEEEGFLKGPALDSVPTLGAPEKREALTASPELKPTRRKSLAFLSHPAACSCCLCSDLVLSALCLRWLLCCAQAELAAGRVPEGLALLRSLVPRCASTASGSASRLRGTLQGSSPGRDLLLPVLGLLDDLVASAYATLALQSLASPQLAEELQEELEKGLSFLASCRPHLPSLGVSRASLLLAKATASLYHLASQQGGSVDGVFASSWAWQLPTVVPAQPEVPAAPQTLKMDKAAPQKHAPPRRAPPKHKPKKPLGPAAPKPGVRKSQRAKAQAVPGTKDVFALGDSDSEVPAIVLRPVPAPCTPCHKRCPLPIKLDLAPRPKTSFTIFSESSPPPSRLLRVPRAVGKVKSRLQVGQRGREGQAGTPGTSPHSLAPLLQVTFSDDSDLEEPQVQLPPRATRKVSCAAPQALSPRPPARGQGSLKGSGGHRSGAQPRRGQPGTHRAGAGGEKKERGTRRAPGRRAEEDLDLLRAAEEQKELELSFEALQASQSLCQAAQGGSGVLILGGVLKMVVLRAMVWWCPGAVLGSELDLIWKISSNPTHSMFIPGVSSLNTALELLKDAFNCIRHCPPATLYSQLCQLMAQALGNQDPLFTAYLLSESFSITTHHQLLHILHRKLHKDKKAAGDVAEQLQGLSLQQEGSAQPGQHLTELQELFTFSCRELGPTDRDSFQAQLQQIPSGVTVCLLALASTQPGCLGDTLLVTRLEKGAAPLNLCIPTRLSRVRPGRAQGQLGHLLGLGGHRGSLGTFWGWEGTGAALIETLETQVLGCWRVALLPTSPQPSLEEEAAQLHPQLRRCGWRDLDPTLLKVLLNAAPLLSSQEVQALAVSLCPERPHRAQLLLEEAVEKRTTCSPQPRGSLILVLDKHLQKLPWENISCLKALPVTRLPSLRFLFSYSLAQKHQAGSVLSRGVDPSNTFYVLNPQSNLQGTEERFRGLFESEPGWKGVIGAMPSQQQMEAALLEHDLYIYAGHGAGARLLDGQAIARLQCRAVAFLFGCSSAALDVRGTLEGSGIVLKYIMAGW
ncbi:ESPL1 protein, partial [Indicator maculatus]|nr:ESPL1 protein [Indicator maculatus]